MDKRIIYQRMEMVNGTEVVIGISIINPVAFEACGLTVEEIAAKDVPTGLPYKIVDATDIPSDRTMRDQWSVGVADLTDGVGA
jgi:hypothetical protein